MWGKMPPKARAIMDRLQEMQQRRIDAAAKYAGLPIPAKNPNTDEAQISTFAGNFHKTLKHDASSGLVCTTEYADFRDRLESEDSTKISGLTQTTMFKKQNKFVDPLAGIAFDTEGADSHSFAIPAPPSVASDDIVAEAAENYWMALLRDVGFDSYGDSPTATAAAANLNQFPFWAGYHFTEKNLFRGFLPGDNVGPYISQFLAMDVSYGSELIPSKAFFGIGGSHDFMTQWRDFIDVQNGWKPKHPMVTRISSPEYFWNGRQMGEYVHIDELFQAYLNACLVMISPKERGGLNIPSNCGNAYSGELGEFQTGFGTMGEPNFKTIVAEVATRALKAAWYQKWYVHRRLRPEAYGGLLEATRMGKDVGFDFPASKNLLDPVLDRMVKLNGTALLPMAYPEGCPVHPSYGAGHATVAGACVTVLKALFKGDTPIDNPMTFDAMGNRVKLQNPPAMTVAGELNKLCSNIGLARNIAGVHWRTDFTASVFLGELVALYMLQEHANTFLEPGNLFRLTRFDGSQIAIAPGSLRTFNMGTLNPALASISPGNDGGNC